MMNSSIALDTNVLIYLHDASSPKKCSIAQELLADRPKIASQVVSEYLNTCRRIIKIDKVDLLNQTAELFKGCPIIPTQPTTLLMRRTYQNAINFNYLIQ